MRSYALVLATMLLMRSGLRRDSSLLSLNGTF